MDLRSALEKILKEWKSARQLSINENSLSKFIRSDFPKIVETVLGSKSIDYQINGSAGAGNWASIPWLSILDKQITKSTQMGYYPVYLFRADMSGVYLSLIQGTTEINNRLGRIKANREISAFKNNVRAAVPQLSSWNPSIELRSNTALGKSYEPASIGAKFYSSESLPANSILEADLLELIEIYQKVKLTLKFPQINLQEKNTFPLPKPFILLAGISGIGKTKWVRDQEEPGYGNLEIIPVRPDWHEPSDLLGYTSRISGQPEFISTPFLRFLVSAWRNAWTATPSLNSTTASLELMKPFWLCLDEMNLAPVEQYFADYLSVLELRKWSDGIYSCPPLLRINSDSDEPIRIALGFQIGDSLWKAFLDSGGIPLPPNLVVVGTVNMDETTHGFSRKVLDRAITVEFDAVDFSKYGGSLVEGHAATALPWNTLSAITDAEEVNLDEANKMAVISFLEAWNKILSQTAFRIAYRSINESLLIANSLADYPIGEVLDWIAMAKLLPRLEGDEDKLGLDRDSTESSYLERLCEDWKNRFGEAWEKSRSKAKLDQMAARLRRSGYTSFWP